MLQRSPVALAKVKADNSENLLKVYSWYQSKEIIKKAYNNMIN